VQQINMTEAQPSTTLSRSSKPKLSRSKWVQASKATHIARSSWKKEQDKKFDSKILLTQDAGYLEPETELEKTYQIQQRDLVDTHLDLTNQAKVFDLDLPSLGPYRLDYSRNGRHILIGGTKGHVAAFDWKKGQLACELHLQDSIRDVAWLHNETMFAVAQREAVYIYDKRGIELHVMKKHRDPKRLSFLPYHFLLASIVRIILITPFPCVS
jgi:U3 small nucleolar RNA-associated protein 7